MDEQASFAPRSVLGPRRAGWNRLAIVVPALALVATAWLGVSGARSDPPAAGVPNTVAVATPSIDVPPSTPAIAPPPRFPADVLGLEVQRLDHVDPRGLGRDALVVVAGWYAATAITDCPPLAVLYRPASLPEVRHDADVWAFCERTGVLYASRPDRDERLPRNKLEDSRSKGVGLAAVAVRFVVGVIVPRELEMIGAQATQVVVIGRFTESGDGCRVSDLCAPELEVDHLAWAAGL